MTAATCKRGHALSEANVLVDSRGCRRCRTCHRDSALASYHRRRRQRSGLNNEQPAAPAEEEGEKANESGGVLNPAVISIGKREG